MRTNHDLEGLGARVLHNVTVTSTRQTLEALVTAASRTYNPAFRQVVLTNVSTTQPIYLPSTTTYPTTITDSPQIPPNSAAPFYSRTYVASYTFFNTDPTLVDASGSAIPLAGILFASAAGQEVAMQVELHY